MHAGADFDRPLSARGRRDAPHMAQWLLDIDTVPERIVTSPAARAKETAFAIAEVLGHQRERIVEQPQIYEASLADLLDVLADQPNVPLMLLIGHNPGLEELLWYLTPESDETNADAKLMPTAAISCLELADEWFSLSRGDARVLMQMRPRALPLS